MSIRLIKEQHNKRKFVVSKQHYIHMYVRQWQWQIIIILIFGQIS